MNHCDYLIIGGGAAGSVIGSRLSEDPGKTILVLEAGRDLVPGHEPADIRSIFPLSTFNAAYMWPDLRAHWRTVESSAALPFPQGRVLGGSSSVMGMWAMRGMPDDYQQWERSGAAGWGWDGVLPFFRRLERDCDCDGPLHGKDGPIPIRRQDRQSWSPLAKAVHRVAAARGMPHIDDMNGDFRDGHCVLPTSRFKTSRASAGLCYLDGSVRARANFRLLTDITATRLICDGHRVIGAAAARRDGAETIFTAGETIVTAGALHTPTLLMRSGIGPAAHLRSTGITIVADRPGVGANLQNHPMLSALALLRPDDRDAPGTRPPASTFLRRSSGLAECTPGDMSLYIRSYLAWHALGRRMALLAPVLMRPASRGWVRLDTDDPGGPPKVEFNFLDDERDLVRLMAGFRLAAEIFAAAELTPVCDDAFVLENASGLMRFNQLSRLNAARGWLAAACLDLSPAFGRSLLRRFAGMRGVASLAGNDDDLAAYIGANVMGTYHVCGTCRIGPASDPSSVVDAAGGVHGVSGLRIGDASVMPTVPSGNTHLPTVMVAEKIADTLRRSK